MPGRSSAQIQRLVENPLALELLEGRFVEGETIRAYAELGAIRFTSDGDEEVEGEVVDHASV